MSNKMVSFRLSSSKNKVVRFGWYYVVHHVTLSIIVIERNEATAFSRERHASVN